MKWQWLTACVFLIGAGVHAQDVQIPIQEDFREEVIRLGDMVQHIGGGGGGWEQTEDAFVRQMAMPPDDSDKWFISLITKKKDARSAQLKADWAACESLLALAKFGSAKESWAHFNEYNLDDSDQMFRFRLINGGAGITEPATVVMQLPRNGRLGPPGTVIYQRVYQGNPLELASDLRLVIRDYVETHPPEGQAEVEEVEVEKVEGNDAPVAVPMVSPPATILFEEELVEWPRPIRPRPPCPDGTCPPPVPPDVDTTRPNRRNPLRIPDDEHIDRLRREARNTPVRDWLAGAFGNLLGGVVFSLGRLLGALLVIGILLFILLKAVFTLPGLLKTGWALLAAKFIPGTAAAKAVTAATVFSTVPVSPLEQIRAGLEKNNEEKKALLEGLAAEADRREAAAEKAAAENAALRALLEGTGKE